MTIRYTDSISIRCVLCQVRQLSGTPAIDSASSSSSMSASQEADGKESTATDESSTSVLKEEEDHELEKEREKGKSDSDIIRDMKVELKCVGFCYRPIFLIYFYMQNRRYRY